VSRLSEASDQPDRSSDELTIAVQVEGPGDLEARACLASAIPYQIDLSPMRLEPPRSSLAYTTEGDDPEFGPVRIMRWLYERITGSRCVDPRVGDVVTDRPRGVWGRERMRGS
jgi:hypothetical protein